MPHVRHCWKRRIYYRIKGCMLQQEGNTTLLHDAMRQDVVLGWEGSVRAIGRGLMGRGYVLHERLHSCFHEFTHVEHTRSRG